MALNCLDTTPGWLIEDLNKIFKSQHDAEKKVIGVNQRIAAKQLGQGRKSINGLGQPILSIPTYSYHYWGKKFGTYACWKDKQFLKEFHRDNEACRIDAKGTRIQVGYGGKTAGATKKFTKKY